MDGQEIERVFMQPTRKLGYSLFHLGLYLCISEVFLELFRYGIVESIQIRYNYGAGSNNLISFILLQFLILRLITVVLFIGESYVTIRLIQRIRFLSMTEDLGLTTIKHIPRYLGIALFFRFLSVTWGIFQLSFFPDQLYQAQTYTALFFQLTILIRQFNIVTSIFNAISWFLLIYTFSSLSGNIYFLSVRLNHPTLRKVSLFLKLSSVSAVLITIARFLDVLQVINISWVFSFLGYILFLYGTSYGGWLLIDLPVKYDPTSVLFTQERMNSHISAMLKMKITTLLPTQSRYQPMKYCLTCDTVNIMSSNYCIECGQAFLLPQLTTWSPSSLQSTTASIMVLSGLMHWVYRAKLVIGSGLLAIFILIILVGI